MQYSSHIIKDFLINLEDSRTLWHKYKLTIRKISILITDSANNVSKAVKDLI